VVLRAYKSSFFSSRERRYLAGEFSKSRLVHSSHSRGYSRTHSHTHSLAHPHSRIQTHDTLSSLSLSRTRSHHSLTPLAHTTRSHHSLTPSAHTCSHHSLTPSHTLSHLSLSHSLTLSHTLTLMYAFTLSHSHTHSHTLSPHTHSVRFGEIERAHGHFLIFFQNYFSHFKPATGYAVQVHKLVMYQLNRHYL